MRDPLRIYPQLILGFLMSIVILASMANRITTTDWVVLPFAVSLFLGGVLVIAKKPVGNWFLLLGSVGVLAAGTFCHYLRVEFMLRHGGMEGPRGYGSPVAFMLGWMVTTMVLFIPGLAFTLWNWRKIVECWKPMGTSG